MGLSIYKPNKNVTGHAATFSLNSKDGALYVEFIKQTGYDAARHIGSFKDGDKVRLKFGIWEVGELIEAYTKNIPWKTVHKSTGKTVSINAGPYFSKDETPKILGYSLNCSVKEDDHDTGKSFSLPMKSSERMILLEYIRFFLSHSFQAIYAEDKKKFKERMDKENNSPKINSVKEDVSTNAENDVNSEINTDEDAAF